MMEGKMLHDSFSTCVKKRGGVNQSGNFFSGQRNLYCNSESWLTTSAMHLKLRSV